MANLRDLLPALEEQSEGELLLLVRDIRARRRTPEKAEKKPKVDPLMKKLSKLSASELEQFKKLIGAQ